MHISAKIPAPSSAKVPAAVSIPKESDRPVVDLDEVFASPRLDVPRTDHHPSMLSYLSSPSDLADAVDHIPTAIGLFPLLNNSVILLQLVLCLKLVLANLAVFFLILL